jgi:hypothetical protein
MSPETAERQNRRERTMAVEELKVAVGMGLHLQLFVDAIVESLKRGAELAGVQKDYVDNIARIRTLATRCRQAVPDHHPWCLIFDSFVVEADDVQETLFNVPVMSHIHALRRIASTYNRCVGVTYWHDFLLGGTEKQMMKIVKTTPLSPGNVQRDLNELLDTIRRQVNYANSVRAHLAGW